MIQVTNLIPVYAVDGESVDPTSSPHVLLVSWHRSVGDAELVVDGKRYRIGARNLILAAENVLNADPFRHQTVGDEVNDLVTTER